jgi:hypothetical protein
MGTTGSAKRSCEALNSVRPVPSVDRAPVAAPLAAGPARDGELLAHGKKRHDGTRTPPSGVTLAARSQPEGRGLKSGPRHQRKSSVEGVPRIGSPFAASWRRIQCHHLVTKRFEDVRLGALSTSSAHASTASPMRSSCSFVAVAEACVGSVPMSMMWRGGVARRDVRAGFSVSQFARVFPTTASRSGHPRAHSALISSPCLRRGRVPIRHRHVVFAAGSDGHRGISSRRSVGLCNRARDHLPLSYTESTTGPRDRQPERSREARRLPP